MMMMKMWMMMSHIYLLRQSFARPALPQWFLAMFELPELRRVVVVEPEP